MTQVNCRGRESAKLWLQPDRIGIAGPHGPYLSRGVGPLRTLGVCTLVGAVLGIIGPI
jgi:hypothetical protein